LVSKLLPACLVILRSSGPHSVPRRVRWATDFVEGIAIFSEGLGASSATTGEEYPMLAGNISAIVVGALAGIIVSLCTRGTMSAEEVEAEWEKTRDIDNPLNPWVQVYKGELKLEEGAHFHDRPALDIVIRKFRAAKLTAYIAGLLFTVLFVCVWPGSMLSIDVMSGFGFLVWTTLSRWWAFVASTFIIVVPLVQEVYAIWRQHKSNQREKAQQNEISSQAAAAAGSKKGVILRQLQLAVERGKKAAL